MKTTDTFTEQGTIKNKENYHQFSTSLEKELVPRLTDKMEFNPFSPTDPLDSIKTKYITFGNFFGDPKFKNEAELSDSEIKNELKNLNDLFATKRLSMVSLTNIDDRTMYRFITEEFLKMEMTGSLYCDTRYIYEEFHSNELYQIKKACSDFLRSFFNHGFMESSLSIWKNSVTNYETIKFFRKRYSDFDEVNVELLSLTFEDDLAIMDFNANYVALHNDQVMISRFSGIGKCHLSKFQGNWHLRLVEIPGV